jgi:hypothetical protein
MLGTGHARIVGTVPRFVIPLLFSLLFVGCSASAPPVSTSSYDHDEAKRLIYAQTNCFTREAQSKSLAEFDLNTAALAVQARCVGETERLKVFKAANTPFNPHQFEAQWRIEEADDLTFIKQALALVRTSKK